jgi:hypothetical protein
MMNRNTTAIILSLILCAPASAARAQARMEIVPSVAFSTAYDDNIFTTQEGGGDTMMLVTPAFEAFYESPNALLRALYSWDMQRAVGYSTLNSLDAKRHGVIDTGFQLTPQFRLSLLGRYDVSDRPGDLMFDTGVLLGRQRARRYQVTPAISVRVRPRTTLTAQYDATREALGSDMRGELYIARLGVSRMQTPRDVWSVGYLGRTFANGPDMFNPPSSERSHALMFGYTRALAVGTTFGVQAGPRVSTYGNDKPEVLANFSKQIRAGKFGLDYWQGETIIMGIRGPVDIKSFSFKSSWLLRRNFEVSAHAGVFNSVTRHQGRARVFHPEFVASYSPGGPYIIAGSYGIDFQKGDVRSEFLADKEVVRHVVLFRMTFAPRLSRIRPADPNDPRSKGVIR